jgi:hypothetical protein
MTCHSFHERARKINYGTGRKSRKIEEDVETQEIDIND